jgi:hypothetical protein
MEDTWTSKELMAKYEKSTLVTQTATGHDPAPFPSKSVFSTFIFMFVCEAYFKTLKVGIAQSYRDKQWAGRSGIRISAWASDFLFSKTSTLVLGPI